MQAFYKKFHPSVENTLATKTEHKVGDRILGTDPVTGKTVSVKIGRFGPVVQVGTVDDADKPSFAQLKKGQSIETITLEEALDLFKLPRTLGEFEDKTVIIGTGRFGPYVRHDNKFISLPKGTDPMEVTLEEAIELIKGTPKPHTAPPGCAAAGFGQTGRSPRPCGSAGHRHRWCGTNSAHARLRRGLPAPPHGVRWRR